MPRLRVGVIGLGVGQQHVQGYLRNPHCQLTAVCDRDEDKLRPFSKPGVKTTLHAADVLEDGEIDLVSIASQDDDHFSHVCQALDRGKHVFVEKPLCQTRDQLQVIKEKWEQHRGALLLQSNLVLRAAPLYRWLKDSLQSGRLGSVYAFDGDYLYGRLTKITSGWRSGVENYSVMAGGGIHLIDLLLWTTGQRPQSVHAWGNRLCTAGTSFRYHDFVAATLTFPSGLIARITANFGCVHGHQHVVRVFGTLATFLHDDRGPRLQTARDPAPPATALDFDPLPPSKAARIDGLVETIVQRRPDSRQTQLDLDVMAVCLASDRSLAAGHSQGIEYV